MKTTLYPDWQDKVVFASDGPKPQKPIETEAFKTVLVGLEQSNEPELKSAMDQIKSGV